MRGEYFRFQSMRAPGERRNSSFVAQNGHTTLGQRGGRMDQEKNGSSLGRRRRESSPNLQIFEGCQLLDHVALKIECRADATRPD